MATYTSGEDGPSAGECDDHFDFGTPPTRSFMKLVPKASKGLGKLESKRSGGKPHRSSSNKSLEPLSALSRQAHHASTTRREAKDRRQKARQQARFFKEIDTTLEALGIGTTGTAGMGAVGPGGSAGSGMPPSPAGSSLSLSLAPSADQLLSTPTGTTAACSRAGTPPLPSGPGAGGFGRRVTSDVTLRSVENLPSGCSTPDRNLSSAWAGPQPPVSFIRSSLPGVMSEAAGLPPRSPALSIPGTAVDRRRTTSMPASSLQPQHRRAASYEGEAAAAAAVAEVCCPAAGPYHPTPSRGGWPVPAPLQSFGGPGMAPSSSASALADRDQFRRQLGHVLVGHGLSGEELEAGVLEAEERAEGLHDEMEALVERAEEAAVAVAAVGEEQGAPNHADVGAMCQCLEDLYRRTKEVIRKVKPYKSLLAEDPELLPRLHHLALTLLAGLAEAADAVGQAACAVLEALGDLGRAGSDEDVRNTGRVVRKVLDTLDHVAKKIGDDLGGRSDSADAKTLLRQCQAVALDLARAGIRAASTAAPVLLHTDSLSADSFAHQKSTQAKRMAALWDEAARQTDRISKRYSGHRLELYGELCEMYGEAGRLALAMTARAAGEAGQDSDVAASSSGSGSGSDSDNDNDSDGRLAIAGAGAWGSTVSAAAAWGRGPRRQRGRGGATDREIQAQAWMPALLQVLLNRASDAHRSLRKELADADEARARAVSSGSVDTGGGEDSLGDPLGSDVLLGLGSGGPSGNAASVAAAAAAALDLSDDALEELWRVLDEMQQTFAELCVANLRRTVRLCSGGAGEPLSLWALELARDAAEAALRFVHTHEHSSMALGDMLGLEEELLQETRNWMRTTWDEYTRLTTDVVNGLLSIRRQINVRRSVMAPPPASAAAALTADAVGRARAAGLMAPGSLARDAALGRLPPGTGPGRGAGPAGSGYGRGRPPTGTAGGPSAPGRRPGGQPGRGPAARPGGVGGTGGGVQVQRVGPQPPPQRLAVSAAAGGAGGGSGSHTLGGLSARTPSQDPNTLAHWYDSAYDGQPRPVPRLREHAGVRVAPATDSMSPASSSATAAAVDAAIEDGSTAATVAATLAAAAVVFAAAEAAAAASSTAPRWKAALLGSPPPVSPSDAAGGIRPGRKSLEFAGPARPGPGAGHTVTPTASIAAAASPSGREPRRGSGTPRSLAGTPLGARSSAPSPRASLSPAASSMPTHGAQRIVVAAAAAARRSQRQNGSAGVHGRGVGRGGTVARGGYGGRGNGRVYGRGRGRLPRGEWEDAEPDADDAASAAGSLNQEQAGKQAWESANGVSSVEESNAIVVVAGATASGTSATASPSWATVAARGGGGTATGTVAPGSRSTAAAATATKQGAAASANTFRSPFATPSAAQQAANASPSGSASATTTATSPFAAAAMLPRPSSSKSASPACSPLVSPQQTPHQSAPPSPPMQPGAGADLSSSTLPPIFTLGAVQQASPPSSPSHQARQSGAPAAGADRPGATAGGSATDSAATSRGRSGGSGGAGGSGSSSFQFAPSTAVASASGPHSGSAAGSSGGRLTPRLGSPAASGPVMPASMTSPTPLAAAAAAAARAGTPAAILTADARSPSAAGMALTDAGHIASTWTVAVAGTLAAQRTASHAAGANGQGHATNGHSHAPQHPHPQPQQPPARMATAVRAPSLTMQLSLGTGGLGSATGLGLTRQGSEGLGAGFGLARDPEVAGLLRAIASDPFWGIRWSDLSQGLSTLVGNGSTGQVFAGMYLHGEVAIKVIGINRDMEYDVAALRAFKAEVDLNKRLNNHTNIVRFIGVCADYIQHAARQAGLLQDGDLANTGWGATPHAQGRLTRGSRPFAPMLAIVMEYCHLGTLWNVIGEARRISSSAASGQQLVAAVNRGTYTRHGYEFWKRWERRLEVLCGAAAGLEYMHKCDVIHHDFTSYNLLLDERSNKWTTKVCDFNLSRVVSRHSGGAPASGGTNALTVPNSGNMYSPRWQSPEYLAGEEYGWSTDVFSFAVVVWEVVTLQQPWASELQHCQNEGYKVVEPWFIREEVVTKGKRLSFPEPAALRPELPELPKLKDLCDRCWDQDPRKRPRMKEVADTLQGLLQVVRVREEGRRLAARRQAAEAQQAASAGPLPGQQPHQQHVAAGGMPSPSANTTAPAAAAPSGDAGATGGSPQPPASPNRSPFARAPASPFTRAPASPFAAPTAAATPSPAAAAAQLSGPSAKAGSASPFKVVQN